MGYNPLFSCYCGYYSDARERFHERDVILLVAAERVAVLPPASDAVSAADSYAVTSPDRRIEVTIETGSELSYSVSVGGRQILRPSPVSMTLASGQVLGKPAAATTSSDMQSVDRLLRPVLKIKRAEIRDCYMTNCASVSKADFP